jgi:hypothetical protein
VLEGDPYWNAPFGRVIGYDELRTSAEPVAAGLAFVEDALRRLGFLD